MSTNHITVSEVLDDACEVVKRVSSPWLGILWLSSMPFHFYQLHYLVQLHKMGRGAHFYGNYLCNIALGVLITYFIALAGRMYYSKACLISLGTRQSIGKEAFKVSLAQISTYFYLALIVNVLFIPILFPLLAAFIQGNGWTAFAVLSFLVVFPVFAALSSLAVATSFNHEKPALVKPLKALYVRGASLRPILFVPICLLIAWTVCFWNLYYLYQMGLWCASCVINWDYAGYSRMLSEENSTFLWLLAIGALMIVEPFWLATSIAYVYKLNARESGEDLSAKFDELTQSREPSLKSSGTAQKVTTNL